MNKSTYTYPYLFFFSFFQQLDRIEIVFALSTNFFHFFIPIFQVKLAGLSLGACAEDINILKMEAPELTFERGYFASLISSRIFSLRILLNYLCDCDLLSLFFFGVTTSGLMDCVHPFLNASGIG